MALCLFHLFNIETSFPTHPNALPYCSGVTPLYSKTSDNVTSDRSLIVTTYESTLSISFLLCFTKVLSIFSPERTILISFDGAQGALNQHVTPFSFLKLVA